jgi:hypothetical protein
MGLWKRMGMKQWPHITVAAFIVLLKPFHNWFQETVFSHGSYKDNKLKKRVTVANIGQFEFNEMHGVTK